MTLTQALLQGLQTTVIGLVIVFSVLAILMVVLMLMKKVFYKEPPKKPQSVAAQQPVKQPQNVSAPVKEEMDEEELIAVLTAAVAASLNTSTYHLQIKSYRRIEQKSPAWNKAGLRETIENRI